MHVWGQFAANLQENCEVPIQHILQELCEWACSRLYYGYCTTHGFRILYYSKSRGVAECTTVVLKPSQRTQRTGYPVYTLALLLPFRRQSIIFGKSRQEYSTVARVCHSLTTVKTELSWLGGSHSS